MLKELENFLTAREIEKEKLNILEVGYIITSDNKCIKIQEDEAHKDIFNTYINFRLENNALQNYSLAEALIFIANEFGDIVYIGPRVQDVKQLTTGNSSFRLQGFFLPDDYSKITIFQKQATQILESTNHSIFNPNAKKVETSYFTVSSGILLTEEEIQNLFLLPSYENSKSITKK